MRRVCALVALIACLLAGVFVSSAQADWYRPRGPAPMFYWQLQGDFTRSPYWQSNIFTDPGWYVDVDGFDWGYSFYSLRAFEGKFPICYISAGTFENWRPDAGAFPAAVKGNNNGWPGEKWLDIRAASVRTIMERRISSTCANAAGIEFDNVDGYDNSTGFPLTARDQLAYNQWLADTAHTYNKFAVLKNDVGQVQALEPYFDAALNEQCAQYSECGDYRYFVNAGKPVWQVEYRAFRSAWCTSAASAGRNLYFANLDLDGTVWTPCPNQPAAATQPQSPGGQDPEPEPMDGSNGGVMPEPPTTVPEQPSPVRRGDRAPRRPANHHKAKPKRKPKPCAHKHGKALKKCRMMHRKLAHI